MSNLTLHLSQLAIEPIEVVSAPSTSDLDLERLLMGVGQPDAPIIVNSNQCNACSCCCCSTQPPPPPLCCCCCG